MRNAAFTHVLKAASCLLLLGCLAAVAQAAWPPWPFGSNDKPGQPKKVIALWTDTVLTQANQPPVRGFGGRLMFYDGQSDKPIKVDGTLVVFAFDETERDPANARPDRKYVFRPDQLPAHYSKSKIGHSYSVWIPWDGVGGMQKDITLIARFEPKTGTAVVGEQCRLLLPGRSPAPGGVQHASLPPAADPPAPLARPVGAAAWNSPMRPASDRNGVQSACYTTPLASANGAGPRNEELSRRMTTTTIPLPPSMAMRTNTAPSTMLPQAQRWQPPPPWQPTPQIMGRPAEQPTSRPTGSPVWQNPPLQRDRSATGRSWAPGPSFDQLARDRALWQQSPAISSSALESQPGAGWSNAAPERLPTALPTSR